MQRKYGTWRAARVGARDLAARQLRHRHDDPDGPGSPLPCPAPWPRDALVWDLNYRGELRFSKTARPVVTGRNLRVHDGRCLFLYGWSEALGCILARQLSQLEFAALEHEASCVTHRQCANARDT